MIEFHTDLLVIGGGINGAGIARDAAGRRLSVTLIESDDLAGATSSASSKLIHGGLRYLEHGEFKLVREALREREVLMRIAPHLVSARSFVLPHEQNLRPQWMIRAGLFLYDHLGGKKILPESRSIDFRVDRTGDPLRSEYTHGYMYADCWVDDTRLVVLNAVDAAARNAKILTHTVCETLEIEGARWVVGVRDRKERRAYKISASMVVNATGPWVRKFLDVVGMDHVDPDLPDVRLVKGSHIIVPRQYEGEQFYILQQPDKRIVFVMPYEKNYTLIGTTEEPFDNNPRDAFISGNEMNYLCAAYNRSFEASILPTDVQFHFSGVRPLLDEKKANMSSNTREYKIYHHKRYAPPMLSVYGGKLTTYRALSEKVVNQLMLLTHRNHEPWTANEPLAGGDFEGGLDRFIERQSGQYAWMPSDLLVRYAKAYGTRMDYFLYGKKKVEDLGTHYGDHVYGAEIEYLKTYEWAQSVEDILWRRSKLGLHVQDETIKALEQAFV